ncbi:hypothetical protein APHCRT_1485 [Anaplasma phagocytophilum str. CRT53-1]|uniref:Uncharacterized protein n=1 Tax=Anaplasma phagocytophilum str. CRT53-1 TaxID=1359157 RepID=A0A0F3PLE8_ANAPH|nr:hypothetical protein APHCRT_1485 [Anaplasma phagocytophilum str. CRT53-1]
MIEQHLLFSSSEREFKTLGGMCSGSGWVSYNHRECAL